MFKNVVLVILYLMAQSECHTLQPVNDGDTDNSLTILISDQIKNEIRNCSEISIDVLYLCEQPFLPLRKNSYFDYKQALCITLLGSVERLCSLKKFTKLTSVGSDEKVERIKVFCNKMKSALNVSLSDTKMTNDLKEWVIALEDRLGEEENCKDACIQRGNVSNPVCSTILQIYNYLNVPDKKMPETSGGADTTYMLDDAVQKPASNVHQESIKLSENIPMKNHEPDVQGEHVADKQEVSTVQKDNPQTSAPGSSHKDAIGKAAPPIKTENGKPEKKDGFVVPQKDVNVKKDAIVSKPEMKSEPKLAMKPNSEIKNESMLKPQTDITAAVEDVNKKVVNVKETSRNAVINKQFSPNKSNMNEPLSPNSYKTNIEIALNEPRTTENKNPDGRKHAGETNENNDKPLQKPEESNKETNEEKPPSDAEDISGKEMHPEPVVSEVNDAKTEDSKASQGINAQNSELPKTASDTSSKKVSPPETDVIAQAQSPETESEITGIDPDLNTLNDETEEQSMGDNQDRIDMDEPANVPVDKEDFITQKFNSLPEIDDDEMTGAEKGPYVRDKFVNAEDSHFFAYFMTTVIICIIGYLVYHNKQKILALALEGRARRSTRRRPNTSGYRKLDSNLEEAVTSACSTSVTHVIY